MSKSHESPARPGVTRRHVLRGLGGASLALPILPSLLARNAVAATSAPPRLVLMAAKQGAFKQFLYDEAVTNLPSQMQSAAGHTISYGPLRGRLENGKRVVSPVLQANANVLTERLLGKLNVLCGLDLPVIYGHNEGAFGNFTADGSGTPTPSLDQIAAWSASYYAAGSFRERSLTIGYESNSFGHANPSTRSGGIQKIGAIGDPQRLWDRVFGSFMPPATSSPQPAAQLAPTRKPLVDYVLEDYKRVRNGNRRLSAEDKRRLDAHMELMAEVQRRVSAPTDLPSGMGCAKPARSAKSFGYLKVPEAGAAVTPPEALRSPQQSIELHRLYNDIVAAAFKCGITRLAAIVPYEKNDPFAAYSGNWHSLAHEGGSKNGRNYYAEAYQAFFEGVMLDLASKLDEDEGNGKTYLDNSLLLMLNEAGPETHWQNTKMCISFGSAGGHFKTGFAVDFRNKGKGVGANHFSGLTLNQFFGNVLEALGIPKAEWERYGSAGRGFGPMGYYAGGQRGVLKADHYDARVMSTSGQPLPVIT